MKADELADIESELVMGLKLGFQMQLNKLMSQVRECRESFAEAEVTTLLQARPSPRQTPDTLPSDRPVRRTPTPSEPSEAPYCLALQPLQMLAGYCNYEAKNIAPSNLLRMPFVILEELLSEVKSEPRLIAELWGCVKMNREALSQKAILEKGRTIFQRICNQFLVLLSKAGRSDLAREVLEVQLSIRKEVSSTSRRQAFPRFFSPPRFMKPPFLTASLSHHRRTVSNGDTSVNLPSTDQIKAKRAKPSAKSKAPKYRASPGHTEGTSRNTPKLKGAFGLFS